MSRKYIFRDGDGIYFTSTSVVFWIDVFTRIEYKDILISSIAHCQKEKGLIVYGYVIMSNHVHLLMSKENTDNSFSDIIRDMQESRREWLIEKFRSAGEVNSQNTNYQFWQQNNRPMQLLTSERIESAINYIHQNPVKAGWVAEPEEYLYSSARNYSDKYSRLKITSVYDGTIV